MRFTVTFSLAAVFSLTLSSPEILAQKEFSQAQDKIAAFWQESSIPRKDSAQRAKVAKEVSQLPGQVRRLVDSGILSYLDSSHPISPEQLTVKIARALAYPYMSVNNPADADGNVSVVPLPQQDAYAIAYDIATCASCSAGWVEIAERRDGHWAMVDWLDNPVADDAVHIAWVGSGAKPLLALYGVHWGDAHNRLDVRLYSTEGGLKQVWSRLDLIEGTIAIDGERMVLKGWTGFRLPCKEQRQEFLVEGRNVRLVSTSFSKVK